MEKQKTLKIQDISKEMSPLSYDAMGRLIGGFIEFGIGEAGYSPNKNCNGNTTCDGNTTCNENESCSGNGSCFKNENCSSNPSCRNHENCSGLKDERETL